MTYAGIIELGEPTASRNDQKMRALQWCYSFRCIRLHSNRTLSVLDNFRNSLPFPDGGHLNFMLNEYVRSYAHLCIT